MISAKNARSPDEQAVEEIEAEAGVGGSAALNIGAEEDRIKILECRREQELDRHRQRVRPRLERRRDDEENGEEVERADDRRPQRSSPPRLADGMRAVPTH
jgi:hypothetical protein